jgi:phosphate-selective porin OprO and OprP
MPVLKQVRLRRVVCSACRVLFVIVAMFAAGPVEGQDSSDPLEGLMQRIEQLEQDKLSLEKRLGQIESDRAGLTEPTGHSTVDLTAAIDDGSNIRAGVDQVFREEEADRDGTIAQQNSRIAALESGWKSFQAKAGEKKYPNVAINGVFQFDAGWFQQDAASEAQFGTIQDGVDFRRARLQASGSVTPNTNYFFQMDFGIAGVSRPQFTDVWMEQTDVPFLGTVRAGQWKQPFSLEVVSSFRYTTFMERSLLFVPFAAFRRPGVGFYNNSEDLSMTWAASVFRSGPDNFGDSISTDGGWGTAERVTFLPYWENEGEDYLHVGAAHFFNNPPNDRVVFRTIPEMFIGQNVNVAGGTSGIPAPTGAIDGTPFFASTGTLIVNHYNVVGAELLWVRGPLSVQSEAQVNFVDQLAGNPGATLEGVYAQVGYFLTGEHRPYNRKAGAIDRVIPKSNMRFCWNEDCSPGWGAWEIAGRYSYLDLQDENINGGTITDYTVGLNWYWNPNTKLVFNWVRSQPNTPGLPTSVTDIYATRVQIDF